MGSFEWMEVETLSTEITALESRLAAAKSRHNYGLVKVVKEQIAAAQQRRARYLAHITTSLAESLESPAESKAAPETPPRQRQKNRDEPAAPEQPSVELADPVAAEAQEEPTEPEAPIAEPAVAHASETAAKPDPASLAPVDPDTPDISGALATPDQPAAEPATAPAAAPAEVPKQLADPAQPSAEPADPIAGSDDASPIADTIEGVTEVWDQLTPTHIEHAKHELGVRRAEMLARHAEEMKALEADQGEINALAQAIDAFVRKFNGPSAASVVRLDEERGRLQNQA